MIIIAWLAQAALAQGLSFPAALGDQVYFSPTSYVDHDGSDWACEMATSSGHAGSDFGVGGFASMDAVRTVAAAAPGVVLATHDGEHDRCVDAACVGGGGFGNYVYVLHDDGTTALYGSLAKFSVRVAVGDQITCGQALGAVGSSGASNGPHLHFELRGADGAVIDPYGGPCSHSPSMWLGQVGPDVVPELGCFDVRTCSPLALLECGAHVVGNTGGLRASSETTDYGCADLTYSGPEMSWGFLTEQDEPVAVQLTGLQDDLDVFVVDTVACDGTDCRAASVASGSVSDVLVFNAEADRDYVIVVDGWNGASSSFTLDVVCEGAPAVPPNEKPPPPPPAAAPGDPVVLPQPSHTRPGCGCLTGAFSPGFAGALLALTLLRRRRGDRVR